MNYLLTALTKRDVLRMCVFSEPVTKKDVWYIAKGVLFVALFLLTILFSIWQWQKAAQDFRAWWNKPVVQQGYPEPTRAELRSAMRHHGTYWSYQGKNRVWYFVNKNKKVCRLFAYQKEKQ